VKLPKIPPVLWIVGGIAVAAIVIAKMFKGSGGSGESLLSKLGLGNGSGATGPQCGPGLYSSYDTAGVFWSVFDGEMKAEQARIFGTDVRGYQVTLDGNDIVVMQPNGHRRIFPRKRTAGHAVIFR